MRNRSGLERKIDSNFSLIVDWTQYDPVGVTEDLSTQYVEQSVNNSTDEEACQQG